MSKFKVGDRVVFKQEGWRGRIVEIKDDGIHVVMFDDGSGDWFREDQLARNSALHSANPVVQNALNRKACNAINPAIKPEYDAYVKAKAKFDKWWSPDRKLSEGNSAVTRDYHEAERRLGDKYREIYGEFLPNGWDMGDRLERACSKPTPNSTACNGYVVLRGVKGGTVKVFEGDSVNWRGREFIAKLVGSPELTKMVIDDDGETYTVDMRDPLLKGYNSTVACNAMSVEIKRKRSGVKTVVPIDEFKKSTQYGRDLTGYERFMLGRGIDKMETDEHRYSVVVTNATDSKALNASRSDAVLADYKKFVKAQMSAAITALETAKRDISAQTEVSARTAKATHANDEHEIVRDYGTKTAMAIGEAVSKLKAAKDNPLIL